MSFKSQFTYKQDVIKTVHIVMSHKRMDVGGGIKLVYDPKSPF